MSTKRRIIRRGGTGDITAAAVQLFAKAMRHEQQTPDLYSALRRSVGLNVWDELPQDVLAADPPEWMSDIDEMRIVSWRRAYKLRVQLLAAMNRLNA